MTHYRFKKEHKTNRISKLERNIFRDYEHTPIAPPVVQSKSSERSLTRVPMKPQTDSPTNQEELPKKPVYQSHFASYPMKPDAGRNLSNDPREN